VAPKHHSLQKTGGGSTETSSRISCCPRQGRIVIEGGSVTRFEPKRCVSTERSSSTLRTAGDGEASHLRKYLQPRQTNSAIQTTSVKLSSSATPETLPARPQGGVIAFGEVSMKSLRVTTSTTENTSKKSHLFRWNMPESCGIMSRNDTGLDVAG